jgi:CheY-like chemotaxis protein
VSILCVDDYLLHLQVMATVLMNEGYSVIATTDVRQAEVIGTTGEDIHLVVTDFTMPHFSGEELAERIRRVRPRMPIIMLSGNLELPKGICNLYLPKGQCAERVLLDHVADLHDVT